MCSFIYRDCFVENKIKQTNSNSNSNSYLDSGLCKFLFVIPCLRPLEDTSSDRFGTSHQIMAEIKNKQFG